MSRRPTGRRLRTRREDARVLRRKLVHAAGCCEPYCASKFWLYGGPDQIVDGYPADGVRVYVPRSLRSQLGRTLGGAQ